MEILISTLTAAAKALNWRLIMGFDHFKDLSSLISYLRESQKHVSSLLAHSLGMFPLSERGLHDTSSISGWTALTYLANTAFICLFALIRTSAAKLQSAGLQPVSNKHQITGSVY